jgi:hypothetical protein
MDDDLDDLTASELRAKVERLRAAIRQHRDSTGHDLCWHHPDMWGLLPESVEPDVAVPEVAQLPSRVCPLPRVADRQLSSAQRTTQEHGG